MLLKDEWLSQFFEGGAYSYSSSDDKDYRNIQQGFIYTKIPSENQSEIHTLIKDDFKLVEILVLFEQIKNVISKPRIEIDIDFVKPKERQDVVEIAKKAFITSRFYQDGRISHSVASQIKENWVANYFNGQRGDNMIVARVDGKAIGFLLLVNKTIIDLIAVSQIYLNKSIASSMIAFANQNFGLLSAGTQLNNQSSLTMYEKCGFLLKKYHFVLHKFVGQL